MRERAINISTYWIVVISEKVFANLKNNNYEMQKL